MNLSAAVAGRPPGKGCRPFLPWPELRRTECPWPRAAADPQAGTNLALERHPGALLDASALPRAFGRAAP